jgi:hypothetical protein
MAIVLPEPDVEKLALEKNPFPPLPCPVIDVVAVILPVVVKAAPTLIPIPPPVPPVQVENTTSELPVNAAPKFTPWLAPVLLPTQLENVTVPVVAGVQAAATETP